MKIEHLLDHPRVTFIEGSITVIPPGTVGGEYVKTKGYYHSQNPSGID